MKYDYEDDSDIMTLEDTKNMMIEDLFLSIFFQHRNSKTYNMLKLPIILPPVTLGK